jgi:phytoene dehydrogenase-like protein
MTRNDAVVVGAGPNGISAAIELARSGRQTLLVEGADVIGGGTRTEELTLPGFHHDVCSAIHPAAIASPFFASIGLEVDWVQPPIPFTHPLDGGRVAALQRSVTTTAEALGEDAGRYRKLMGPIVDNIEEMVEVSLNPVSLNPKHKVAFARLATIGALPAAVLARRFHTEEGKALISGMAAHAIRPFHAPATAAVGLMLGAIGHAHGWPMARGGSASIAAALEARFTELGGVVELGRRVTDISELDADLTLLDVMPPAAVAIAGGRLGSSARRRMERWRPGSGVFKVD